MTDRRGFALLTALWLLVALATIAAGTLAAARLGGATSHNRVLLRRATWGAEACVAILLARYDSAAPRRGVDSTDLGRRTWCWVTVEDPSSRLNLNRASAEELQRLLGDPALTDAVLDWRDRDDDARPNGAERATYEALHRALPRNAAFAAVRELQQVLGFERASLAWLEARLTVRGAGPVNLMTAHPDVLRALGFFTEVEMELILAARATGRRLTSVDDLLARIGPTRRDELAPGYGTLISSLAVVPHELTAEVEAGVGDSPIRAHVTLTLVPLPTRLAMVRREIW